MPNIRTGWNFFFCVVSQPKFHGEDFWCGEYILKDASSIGLDIQLSDVV